MRRYELMVILDPDLEERAVAPSLDQFLGVVRSGSGGGWSGGGTSFDEPPF